MAKITDINGIEVGHSTHSTEKTGCTVILCKKGAVAGIDIRGSAPGTRETELLRPGFMVRKIHAILLTGGSAFGLRTADGVMQYLSERGFGYDARGITVPIVPAAVIFDLRDGRDPLIPDVQMGYQACENAGERFEEGLVGAGRGATVGKILGLQWSMNGGVATTAIQLPGGIKIGVLVVVNALGDIINPENGKIIAGVRSPDGKKFLNSLKYIKEKQFKFDSSSSNTTLAVVATNAHFNKEEINKIAQMAQNGIGRSVCPVHTMHDGDIVFALSTGKQEADLNVVGEVAAQLISEAIVKAVRISNQTG